MAVLSLFKPAPAAPAPFDALALLASWPDAPRFLGKRKADPPVRGFLHDIVEGCTSRSVPKPHWPAVAVALMGPKARERVDAFTDVLSRMEGRAPGAGPYVWTSWERFELAMLSMNWEISRKNMRVFTIAARKGLWWVVGKRDKGDDWIDVDIPRDTPSIANVKPIPTQKSGRKMPIRAMSDSFSSVFKLPHSSTLADAETVTVTNAAAVSESKISQELVKPTPRRANTEPPVKTTVTHAPEWLLSSVAALEFLTAEYPHAISAVSAILLAVGAVPAIAATGGAAALPALAGAGTAGHAAIAVLAGPTAQALGAVTMGLGRWLKTHVDQNVVASQ